MNASARLFMSETAQSAMTTAAARAHPNETGGILVGVHTDGHPWITVAVEISSSDRGRTHYRIPAGTTQEAVLVARARDHRLGYLGDWHTHPHDVGPSCTDRTTLALISLTHPRQPNPTQIIVRRTEDGHTFDARRIIGLTARACTVTLTGDLIPPTPTADDARDSP
ncbi:MULTISPECIES: Mov34/MPN/PAD-1 family protein [Mycobacteriaceae]|uniref:JAB domain-containing protein n=2 Tax=Mycolicibacterium TaxID=1866885 RepID=A0A1E8Q1V3_9MYCO|nr:MULTISPECIES: Mov34/MPN/PAD-1 family protein [Mycobacteriaceae]KIU14062.1 hypothetical protein TL10_26525 [Mycolicibacterium llatzerense]OFJ52356.1 hypothetical protein BEL07_18095 [Mycolicibacterium grossiae]SHW91243.1 Uncharacterised protein [Mycobacteroides abscessus subsp. abscessus]SII12765.1 Uncharacterised protein [Mycobacteroides abscessus subsp. abscessus]SLJ80941.1 Uncharacterised protein [Mycobacteroides abscessus subsp. abscessus]